MSGDGSVGDEFVSVPVRLTVVGFGTVRAPASVGRRPPPPTASARAYLRGGLPGIYQDEDFGMRFVGALEELLDPIVGLLDALPAHFTIDLAPADVLELLTAWLGIELRESQPTPERRTVLRYAAELGRRRGTEDGLELVLKLAFPGVPFRVEDAGGVVWARGGRPLPDALAPGFVVYCDVALSQDRAAAVARVIEQVKPAHVPYKLRVKAPRRPTSSSC